MKENNYSERKKKERYQAQLDFNKRNYRLEKNTSAGNSDSAFLRWMAERRYL